MKYCSLDIEATGFDPEFNQIIELGFVIFDVTGNKLEVIEKWDQVFNPGIQVEAKILGLTGITEQELLDAPEFASSFDFLQDKLKDVVLVGHNIKFDIAFLEKNGIKLLDQHIDTLDLVQVLLPSYPSYNLENVMHGLGISQKNAHRALADAVSVVELLERLLQIYNALPLHTQRGVVNLLPIIHPLWPELFNQELGAKSFIKPFPKPSKLEKTSFKLIPQTVEHVINTDWIEEKVTLAVKNTPTVVVVSEKSHVLRLWRQRLAEGIFLPEDTFDAEKLEQKLASGPKDSNEAKFLFKILVWQATNWQTESLQDLNLSFFGNQYKGIVAGGNKISQSKIVVCDYATFLSLYKNSNQLEGRNVIILGLDQFSEAAMASVSKRLSWAGLVRWIEEKLEDAAFKNQSSQFEALLSQVDLFFGLLQIYFKNLKVPRGFLTWESLSSDSFSFSKLQQASRNLASNLSAMNMELGDAWLNNCIEALEEFFVEDSNYVRWVEQNEASVILFMQPESLPENVYPVNKTTYVDFNMPKELSSFLLDRLGASNYEVLVPNERKLSEISTVFKVDLPPNEEFITELMEIDGPTIIIFPSLASIKSFYDENYKRLQEKYKVWAQGYSGGNQKIFNNFALKPESILFSTPQFMAKARGKINIKHLYWLEFGKSDDLSHYFMALNTPGVQVPAVFQQMHGVLNRVKLKNLQNIAFYGWNHDSAINQDQVKGYLSEFI